MYKHILVPTDGTELSHKAVREASRLAAVFGAELLILHVRSPLELPHHVEGGALTRLPPATIEAEVATEEHVVLDAAAKIAAAAGARAAPAFIHGYSVYEAIIRVATEQECDLIVMASHGRRGLSGLLIGSETQKVLTHVATPVLVVR